MNRIKILDKATASKIAAGEVIERPAGVLKELLENSLDAGATIINTEIASAGKKLIRVNDNGLGIAADDMATALLRHSTSKINNFEDLDSLNTFGFRGEALYSVAAISDIAISSAREGAGEGRKITAAAGAALTQMPAPAVRGTTVEVRNLFFNTPARLKFLKSDNVERGHLLRCFEEAALANPQVAFNISCDNVKVYNLPAQEDNEQGLRRRLAKILGEEVASALIWVEDKKYNLKAFISPIDKLTAARDRQFLFVNKRPVSCKILQQAVFKSYQQYRGKDRYPAVILFMTMPPASFDVNIHPQKRDIKFVNESDIFSFISNTFTAALLGGGVQKVSLGHGAPVADIPMPAAIEVKPQPKAQTDNLFTALRPPSMLEVQDFEEPKPYNTMRESEGTVEYKRPDEGQIVSPVQKDFCAAWWKGPYTYLGQIHQSYIAFENEDGLVLVDQHAAQERVLFEQYLTALEHSSVKTQPLMFPVNVDLPASDIENILAWGEYLNLAGFDIVRFSARTILVNSIPAVLKLSDDAAKTLIIQLAAVLGDPSKSSDALKHKLIATMACKKAVKAGEKLESKQAQALMENLRKCKDGLHCPHGRPTIISIDSKEIAKKFGRL